MSAYGSIGGGGQGVARFLEVLINQLPQTLSDGTEVEVVELERGSAEAHAACDLLNRELAGGMSYPQFGPLDEDAFSAYYLSHDALCMRRRADKFFMGSVYIKPNFPGRSGHICNGGFIVHESVRGIGVGSLLAKYFMALAPMLGFEAVFFNLVFADNEPSLRIWKKLGFQHVGTITQAAKKSDGSGYQDAFQMYYRFTSNHTSVTDKQSARHT